MAGCIPCRSLQPAVKHLNECYPPPKQLVAAGPEFKPLSQDLSKLVYFALNKPSQLAKIGEELEKRVQKEAKGSTGGYPKSRASLLISLAILKSLITECKRDLSLFSRYIIRIINTSLNVKVYQKGELDLEVVGRAASCFTSFSTFTDGNSIGVDDTLTAEYLDVLRKFANLGIARGNINAGNNEKPDMETQSRTRLIALAAIHGAAGSDALFSSNAEFPRQIRMIVPPLLANIFECPLEDLKMETAKIEIDTSPSPYFSEFSAKRPIIDRRAPSLHEHIPGEKGPSSNDVLSAALRSLRELVAQCQVNQASQLLDAVFAFLDQQGWSDVERCCWLAQRLVSFTSLQYRFVVPTRLVETLADIPDGKVTVKQSTVLAMITTILNSSTSLVGLGVSDLLNNLVSIIIRRIHVEDRDALLPPLVQCIASLGTHIYYADQINDIVEEIALQIAGLGITDKSRSEILRVLIACITGVMTTAQTADEVEARATSPPLVISPDKDKGKAPQLDIISPVELPRRTTSTRPNPIALQVFQETLPLLCEASYTVRAAYARSLLLYIENEMPRDHGPVKPGDLTAFRFCNALNAAVYTLAMSSCLGPQPGDNIMFDSTRTSPTAPISAALPEVKVDDKINDLKSNGDENTSTPTPTKEKEEIIERSPGKGVSFNITEPTPGDTPPVTAAPTTNGNGMETPPKKTFPRNRRVSLPLNRINSSAILASFDNVATALDFAWIIKILTELHSAVPVAALATGLPMLLALDRDAGIELIRRPNDGRQGAWVLERKRAIRELVAIVWGRIGEKWDIKVVQDLASKAYSNLPEPFVIPPLPFPPPPSVLPLPDEPERFFQNTYEGESSSASQPLIDPEILVSAFADSEIIQTSTGRDASMLMRRFNTKWTVENAIKDSVERFSSAQVNITEDTHFDVANIIMNIENPSYQSFIRPQSQLKTIDVGDLRDALGGRVDTISSSSPPSIVSTAGTGTIPDESKMRRSKKATNPDVKEVLKDIFKDKKRGGTGKKSSSAAAATASPGGGATATPTMNGVNGSVSGSVGNTTTLGEPVKV